MCSSCFYVFWPLFSILTFAEIASNQPLLRGYDTGKRWNSTVEKTAIWRNEALYQCTSLHCRDITTSPAMIGAANIFGIWKDLSWIHLPNLSAREIPDFTGVRWQDACDILWQVWNSSSYCPHQSLLAYLCLAHYFGLAMCVGHGHSLVDFSWSIGLH